MDSESHYGRTAFRGALIGFPLATVLGATIGLANGFDTISAIGIGLFVGIWGGLGFGAMLGATTALAKELDNPTRS